MNMFAVVFTDPLPVSAVNQLRNSFPGLYEMVPNTVYLVRSDELSSDVATKAGIKSDPRIARGAVFKLNHAYSGFTSKDLWEWLGD